LNIFRVIQEAEAVEKRKSLIKIQDVKNRRSNEIYIRWKEMRRELDKVAEEASREVDKNWKEQGRNTSSLLELQKTNTQKCMHLSL